MIQKNLILRLALVLFIININEGETFEWVDVENLPEIKYEPPETSLQKTVKPRQTPVEALSPMPHVKYVNVDDYQGPELVRSRRFLKKICKKGLKKLFKKDKCKKKKKCDKCDKCDKCEKCDKCDKCDKWEKCDKSDDYEGYQPKKESGYSYDTHSKCDCGKKKCPCEKDYGKKCDCKYSKDYDKNKITVKPIIHLVPITPQSYGGCTKGCDGGYAKPSYGGGGKGYEGGSKKPTAQITKVDVVTYTAPVKAQTYDKGGSDYGNHGGYEGGKSNYEEDCYGDVGYSGTSHGYEVVNHKKGGNNYNEDGGGYSGYGNTYKSSYDSSYNADYVSEPGYSGSKLTAFIEPMNKKEPIRIYRSKIKGSPISDDFEYT